MDRYNQLKKLFNMSETTVKNKKQVPTWYAQLKANSVCNRIFSNAIADPNSQLVKALLFSEFKLPMNNNYDNIVTIFQAILESKHANQELIDWSVGRVSGASLSSLARPERTRTNPTQTNATIIGNMSIPIDEWWGERTEYWRVDETRWQRSNDEPNLYMEYILEHLINGAEYQHLDDLEEYIEDPSQDPDDMSHYETENTETTDDDYIETGNTDTGYNLPGTMLNILNRLRWFRQHPDDPESIAVSNHIVISSNNETTLHDLIELLENNI